MCFKECLKCVTGLVEVNFTEMSCVIVCPFVQNLIQVQIATLIPVAVCFSLT